MSRGKERHQTTSFPAGAGNPFTEETAQGGCEAPAGPAEDKQLHLTLWPPRASCCPTCTSDPLAKHSGT